MITYAIEAAKIGGKILRDSFRKIDPALAEEKSPRDFVTEVDKRSEDAILNYLSRHFPEDAVVAEESGTHFGKSDYRWYIDPLDGTKNYMHGFSMFCVSIGLARRGELVAGVVYDPMLDELFTAEKGKGAFLNGSPIRVSPISDWNRTLLATGFPHRSKEVLDLYLESFRKLFVQVSAVRRSGSAALDLAYVAAGRFEGFWELKLNPYDIAAGILLVQEAGGVVSDLAGGNSFLETGNILTANPHIYPGMLSVTKQVFGNR
ncbi:inositol-1-monophosphatase [bacterium BMS3Abin05]|nr:inositol-1-monophosphatase [bacterium BMS3Abin05]GBE26379.1 inositol-1-monophosphatase [bacterium BMS3Bbin03]